MIKLRRYYSPPDPEQVMLWIALVVLIAACFILAAQAEGADRRIRPDGPTRQLGVDYTLDRAVGVWSIDYGSYDYEMAELIADEDIRTVNLWTDTVPYCAGHWVEPYPSHQWVTDEPGCAAELFWKHTRARQIFIRFHAWEVTDDGGCRIMDRAPHAFILNRLYEVAWNVPITVVFAPWEQDWYALGCAPCNEQEDCIPDTKSWEEKREAYMLRQARLLRWESRRQGDFEQARAAMMQRYPNARLKVLRAMVVNRNPWNLHKEPWAADLPKLAERIPEMKHQPDLVGVSYYHYGIDPAQVLDWYEQVTEFPRQRMFIAEFGGKGSDEQVQRINDYVPAFWDWGIRTVLLWNYYQPGESHWTLSDEALDAVREMNIAAIGGW